MAHDRAQELLRAGQLEDVVPIGVKFPDLAGVVLFSHVARQARGD